MEALNLSSENNYRKNPNGNDEMENNNSLHSSLNIKETTSENRTLERHTAHSGHSSDKRHSGHSSHRSSSHGSHDSHHHHSHSSKYNLFIGENFNDDKYDHSAEMERKGQNVIYKYVHKQKISDMIRRSIFCLLLLSLLIFLIYSIVNTDSEKQNNGIFNHDNEDKDTIEELQDKIYDMEDYIYELENRLSQYEQIEHRSF